MRLAHLRRLAWTLVLVLLAGLGTPAFASLADAGHGGVLAPGAHVHSGGARHVHAKAPQHCPGCLTPAECALSCLGVGLLPASVVVPASPAGTAWTASALPSPAGTAPAGDLDPPKPVSVR